MALFSTKFMMATYLSDFASVSFNALPVKIQSDAPKRADLYDDRAGGVCAQARNFTPRRLRVTFKDGRQLLYPVPSIADIPRFVKALKPSVVDSLTPDVGSGGGGLPPVGGGDEAICIDLLGEKWGQIPRKIASPKLESPLDIPYGSIKKLSYNFKYNSDILGDIRIGTQLETVGLIESATGDLDKILNCQKAGMEDRKEGATICAGANEVDPRRFILSVVINNNQNQKGVTVTNRQVIIASPGREGLVGNIINGFQPQDVASKIEACARCIGYVGESVTNVDQLIGQNLFG